LKAEYANEKIFEMKKNLLLILAILPYLGLSQTCSKGYEVIFEKRGADHVEDGIHKDVVIDFVEHGQSFCYSGKARIEEGKITSIWIELEDDNYLLIDGEAFTADNKKPGIANGISDWFIYKDGRKARVLFIAKIKPEPVDKKPAMTPEEWLKNN
jgi:hypothetical protein